MDTGTVGLDHADMATKTVLELTDAAMIWHRDALVEEMMRTCKTIREHLRDHLDGSNVALANSRDALRTLNGLADSMEQLDPPGWREPTMIRSGTG